MAFPYLRLFLVRYYANVRRDERNRTNRSKRLTCGARIRPINHRGVRYYGGACRARRRRVEKEGLRGDLLEHPYIRQLIVRYYANVRRVERNRANRSKVAISPA